MKIGVRLHDLGTSTPEEMAKRAKEIGFDGVQLVLNKAISNETGLPGTLTKEKAISIGKAFNDEGLGVFMLGAYFNPVHSDKNKVALFIDKFKEHLTYCNDFGCSYVGSETGSFNDDKWTYHPNNRTPEAIAEVKRIFGELAECAKENASNIALEGAFGHCCFEPKCLNDVVRAIDNGHVYVTVDMYNYLAISNYERQREIFDECVELFKDKIVIFHIKDFVVDGDSLKQVAIGKGIMDFDYMLPIIKKNFPNAYLIFEGSKPCDMQDSYDFITKKLKED